MSEYIYRNRYRIKCIGYHQPDHRVVWEATDMQTNCAAAHGYSKCEVLQILAADEAREECRATIESLSETIRTALDVVQSQLDDCDTDSRHARVNKWKDLMEQSEYGRKKLNAVQDALLGKSRCKKSKPVV